MDNKKDLLELTGLWEGAAKDGKTFLSGKLNSGVRVYVFENAFRKEGSNEPTHRLYLAKASAKEAQDKEEEQTPPVDAA